MKNVILILLTLFLISCNEKNNQSGIKSTEVNEIDVKAELASIEETRAGFQLAIKDLGGMLSYHDLSVLAKQYAVVLEENIPTENHRQPHHSQNFGSLLSSHSDIDPRTSNASNDLQNQNL